MGDSVISVTTVPSVLLPPRIRRHHVVLTGAVLIAATMLALSGALFADAAVTHDSYNAVAAHRVEIPGKDPRCFPAPYRAGPSGVVHYATYCRATYSYAGRTFEGDTPTTWPLVFEVDSRNPGIRENKAVFANGPKNVVGDLVGAVLLLVGAAAVTAVHQIHYRRRRRNRRREAGGSTPGSPL